METMMKNLMGIFSLSTVVSTILLLYIMAVSMGGIHAASGTPKCDVVSVNSPWTGLSNGLELMFGDSEQDFGMLNIFVKLKTQFYLMIGMLDSIRPCLQRRGGGYYWLQTCLTNHAKTIFDGTRIIKINEDKYYNYVCVTTKDIKAKLTIQVEDQSNTTYSNKETKNPFQAWTGETLNLYCEPGLINMLPHLCVKSGTSNVTCNNSSIMTWTPENCEGDITVTCELRHCPRDTHPAVQTDVSIKVQCPLEIVSFTSNSREGTEGTHIYKTGEDATFTCVTKGSSDVTIVKTQGMNMRGTVVSRNHTYSVTSLSCDDMGTYYCIAKQGDTQVNRSINIAVHGLCPPRLCSEETQGKRSLDMKIACQPVTLCVMAFPVLSNWVSFNGQSVLCDGGISSPGWQCSIKKSQHFMTYNFTFTRMIHNVTQLVDKKITVGLKTSDRGVLNLTYNLNSDGGPNLNTPLPLTPSSETSETGSLSLGVIIAIVFSVIILLIVGLVLGVLYWKFRGKLHRYKYHRALSLMPNHNGHSNEGSKNTDDVYASVNVGSTLESSNPSQNTGESQESEESQYTHWGTLERESNINLYQNISETKCSSTEEGYANLRTLKNMPSPGEQTVSQPANNGTLNASGLNDHHPMRPVSSTPTTGSYISPEGLHYVTVAHSQSSGSKQSSMNTTSTERDSVQYASLNFEKTGKYDTHKDKRKLKRLKHKTRS